MHVDLVSMARDAAQHAREKGLVFVAALYEIVDEDVRGFYKVLDESVARPVCARGCSRCCYQEVTVILAEREAIEAGLATLDRRRRREILKKAAKEWEGYLDAKPFMAQPMANLRFLAATSDDWVDQPCPFLENGNCLIYTHRPLVCRRVESRVRCASVDDPSASFRELMCDRLAEQILIRMDEEMPSGTRFARTKVLRELLFQIHTERNKG